MDAVSIQELFQADDEYIPTFEKEEWGYITDNNNSNYVQQIQFTTKDVLDKKIVWRESYLTIPLKINALAGTNKVDYTAETKVALKQSVLSLVYGLIVNQIGAGPIVSDTQIQFINNLRLMLETNTDWLVSNAPLLQFGIDNVVWDPTAPATKPLSNSAKNSGLDDRIKFLQMNGFVSADHAFEFLAYIPLRFLHPIFECANFPMLGSNFELFIQHSFGTNNQYPCLMVDSSDVIANNPSAPQVTIAMGPSGQSQCRLYYKSIELNPHENAKYLAKLAKGFKIRREYLACDTYSALPNLQASTSAQALNNYVITTNCINPVSLYALLLPVGTMTGPVFTANQIAQNGPSSLPMTPVGKLTNASVYLNGTNVYPNTQLNTSLDFWQLLKQKFIGDETNINGGPISYYDFLRAQRIHYFDLSKTASKYENKQVSISMTASRESGDSASVDYLFLVEKRSVVEFNLSSGVCTIVAGQSI